MLETLRIGDYALIDHVELDFAEGFTVLTGETGAGKSIIVGALNLVLGARASGDAVRDGASKASVEAVFRLGRPSRRLAELLARHDLSTEGGELLVSRTVSTEGRSRAYVNGALVPVSVLSEIGDELVDLHGQHEHQSLLKPERQLDLLDTFAGASNEVAQVAAAVEAVRALDDRIAQLETDDRERARRVEFLRFELAEIDAAGLEPEEEEEVKGRRNLITHAERIVELASQAYTRLYDDDGAAAVDRVDGAARELEELAGFDERFRALGDQLATARALLEEASATVRGFAEGVEYDPEELERLNQRIALIGDLKRKYGDSVPAVLAYRDRAREEVEQFERRDETLAGLRREREARHAAALELARALSARRDAAARRLEKQVSANLQQLGMKGGRFEARLEPCDLGASGIDRAEYLLAANVGEKLKPLRQVASGGEISRVMLGLKAVFAHADHIPTLIFDEIDAGVGGAVARQVAAKLCDLAESHQTLCITHIAQIAAVAGSHYSVAKSTEKGRTVTSVTRLEGEARVRELARLLDGSVSEVSVDHARALLSGGARA